MSELKFTTAAEVCIKLWSYWQKWRPTTVRRRPWNTWSPYILPFRGSTRLLNDLARFPAIFSHIGPDTMVAEAPDHHRCDPGRLEEVRNGLIGADTVGRREV